MTSSFFFWDEFLCLGILLRTLLIKNKEKPVPGHISTRAEDLQYSLNNRPGAWRGWCFSGRGPLLFWLSNTLALLKKTPAELRGGGLGVSISMSPLWGTLLMGGAVLPQRREFVFLPAQETLTEEQCISHLVPQVFIRYLPSPCPWQLPAPVLYLRCTAEFQYSKF